MRKHCPGLQDTTGKQTGIKSPILQTSNKSEHFEEKQSSENDLSTSYSFNIKMFSPVISFIVQMKMSGGTKILRMISFVSTSSSWGDKYTNLTAEYTHPHLPLPNSYCLGTARDQPFLRQIFL